MSETPSMIERARDLSNRLRGRYAKGPILPNGEPEFGWSVFTRMPGGDEFPSIYGEAATVFDEAAAALQASEAARTLAERERDATKEALDILAQRYLKQHLELQAAETQLTASKSRVGELEEGLRGICSEFAQQHPLIRKAAALLSPSQGGEDE